MPNIKITVAGKIATNTTPDVAIVCGNSDYTVTFDLDAEWAAEDTRTARFSYVRDGRTRYKEQTFEGNTVTVPALSGVRQVTVGVYAGIPDDPGDLHTTTGAAIWCMPSILCGDAVEEITPEEKAGLQQQIAELAARPGNLPDWSQLKWYIMGDSLTDRNNTFAPRRYYDFIQAKTGIQIVLDGIGGTGYGAGVSNGTHFVERVKNIPAGIDVVTIFGSANDVRHANGANQEIYTALSWLRINRPELRVIVIPPAPVLWYDRRSEEWTAYYNRLELCAFVCGCRFAADMHNCPPFDPMAATHMEMFFSTDPEGVHPNEAGHEAMAPIIYNALLKELALK